VAEVILMAELTLDASQIEAFNRDGYLAVPGLMSEQEVNLFRSVAEADAERKKQVRSMPDSKGRESKLWFETIVKEDFYSAVVRWDRLVRPTEQLLGGPVHQLHHKLMVKEPRVGGAWEWHQDYGYWYGDGFVYPDMASCMIAVDRASKANGCLQVLRSSHKMGRISHGRVGNQTGADMERVTEAMKRLELVYCEMEPGTALFFHCNTLHRSDANRSENSRWSFISCYTAAHNPSFRVGEHAYVRCTPIEKWSDDRIIELGRQQLQALQTA
jgi:ectoine hydroxylase